MHIDYSFGEKIKNYSIRVLNEREVRAAAGIFFLFASIAFFTAWFSGNYYLIKLFVISFLVDFSIRLFINPKYAPTMTLGRLIVNNQNVEYVGAPQKRFAWGIGFVLAATMFFLVIVREYVGPINLFVCLICLTLLFFESVFGICIGCIIYKQLTGKKSELCPGGVCEIRKQESIQQSNSFQLTILSLFVFGVVALSYSNMLEATPISTGVNASMRPECAVPEWAIKIGHEEQWKLHNKCN